MDLHVLVGAGTWVAEQVRADSHCAGVEPIAPGNYRVRRLLGRQPRGDQDLVGKINVPKRHETSI